MAMAGAYRLRVTINPQFMKAQATKETPLWPGTAQAVRQQCPCRGLQCFSLKIQCGVPGQRAGAEEWFGELLMTTGWS